MTLKDEFPQSVGAQYATGEEWRNSSRKNEETEPKQKQRPVVGVTGDGSEVPQSCPTIYDPMDCSLHQAPPSMGFSRQEYWSGLPFPFPGNLPDPGIEPRSPSL